MTTPRTRCLILSCGNTLRSDDGIGPFLSEWARDHYASRDEIQIITRHQWTPDLALDLAEADAALFIDCSVDSTPGEIRLRPVEPATEATTANTHQTGATELLALAKAFYNAAPASALLLTIGAGSLELGESFSSAVHAVIGQVQLQILQTVEDLLQPPQTK